MGGEGVFFLTVTCDQERITRPQKKAIRDVITSLYSNQDIRGMIRPQAPWSVLDKWLSVQAYVGNAVGTPPRELLLYPCLRNFYCFAHSLLSTRFILRLHETSTSLSCLTTSLQGQLQMKSCWSRLLYFQNRVLVSAILLTLPKLF